MKSSKIGHIGVIVDDLQKAVDLYTKVLGIKKWYEIIYDDGIKIQYHGKPSKSSARLVFGGNGHTVIELIKTEGEENIYTNALKNKKSHIHHIQYDVKNLDSAVAEAESAGMKVFQTGQFKSGGAKIRYAYVGLDETETVLEYVETNIFGKTMKFNMCGEFELGLLKGSYKKFSGN